MKFLKNIWAEIQEIKSGMKELREFGMVMTGFFGILAGIGWWRGKNFLPALALSIFFALFTMANPKWLKPLQKIWMTFALVMGFVMTHVIMGLLFFLVVTPLSLLSRALGKKYLNLEFRPPGDSYWMLKTEELPKERYEKQF